MSRFPNNYYVLKMMIYSLTEQNREKKDIQNTVQTQRPKLRQKEGYKSIIYQWTC